MIICVLLDGLMERLNLWHNIECSIINGKKHAKEIVETLSDKELKKIEEYNVRIYRMAKIEGVIFNYTQKKG